MKVKTSDLIDPALDWAVAKCLQPGYEEWRLIRWIEQEFAPTANWEHGGPIIERECIGIERHRLDGPCQWAACDWHSVVVQGYTCLERSKYIYGPTQLIAAMRCFVASKLSDEVDVPDELV